jgi:hypothetical protein
LLFQSLGKSFYLQELLLETSLAFSLSIKWLCLFKTCVLRESLKLYVQLLIKLQ